MKLEGRVLAVTGASGNLGSAIAAALLEAGAKVVLLDRDPARLSTMFGPSCAEGRASAHAADLGDERSARAALDAGAQALGGLHGLACTVGGYASVPAEQADLALFDQMLTVNLKTTVACTRAALPALLARGEGSIVHVASLAALRGGAGEAAYSAAKAAVLRYSEAVAEELKGRGVRVNAVLPGTIDTPQNRAWMSAEQAALAVDPRAIADAVLFLLSDAARAVTGAQLRITGRQ
jgi:NAD(P)-dependent dehydrogenase (short-subunit alcohol dehydrogenase family)